MKTGIFRSGWIPDFGVDVAKTKKNRKRTKVTEQKNRRTDEKEERREETNGNKTDPDFKQC